MSWGTNVLVGQSGGPTAVINSSLAGVYEAAKALGAAHVYGMEYGIQGLLQGKIVDLDDRLDDKMEIELLKRTPSSYLGSCRFKLPNPATDERPFVQLFELFAPTFVHGEVPRTRLRMLAMRCAGLQIYNSWMVPQYLAFLQAGGFAVQEHALLGDTLAPLCYARAVPDKTRVAQR